MNIATLRNRLACIAVILEAVGTAVSGGTHHLPIDARRLRRMPSRLGC
jgi:hypothetical protein